MLNRLTFWPIWEEHFSENLPISIIVVWPNFHFINNKISISIDLIMFSIIADTIAPSHVAIVEKIVTTVVYLKTYLSVSSSCPMINGMLHIETCISPFITASGWKISEIRIILLVYPFPALYFFTISSPCFNICLHMRNASLHLGWTPWWMMHIVPMIRIERFNPSFHSSTKMWSNWIQYVCSVNSPMFTAKMIFQTVPMENKISLHWTKCFAITESAIVYFLPMSSRPDTIIFKAFIRVPLIVTVRWTVSYLRGRYTK